MKTKLCFIPLIIALALNAQTVHFDTVLGGIDVVLTPSTTPLTVANFMSYVTAGAYSGTIIHRNENVANQPDTFYIVEGGEYVVQVNGGGKSVVQGNPPIPIRHNPTVLNEYAISNTRGTLAMARFGQDINSATSSWFFNVSDNSAALDPHKFVVFGNVAAGPSLAVMDLINAVPTYPVTFGPSASFPNLPIFDKLLGFIPRPPTYMVVRSIH